VEQIELTWVRALKFWWSFAWRAWVLMLLTACASTSRVADTTTVPNADSAVTFQIPVTLIDADGKELRMDAVPKDLTLWMGVIPGSIGGNPKAPFANVVIGRAHAFSLELASLKTLAAQAAASKESPPSAMKISPGETRFLRLSTQVWSKTIRVNSLVRFVDSETREILDLVYFDRPCQLTGKEVSQDVADYDVVVDSPGWTWLAGKKVGPRHYSITRPTAPHPTLEATLLR
jgi:hypothetical protein